ncbi:MAG: Gldg family protein [Thermoflexales bacterium]|nr:Gldg family protein [Thermoflexales bacterium]
MTNTWKQAVPTLTGLGNKLHAMWTQTWAVARKELRAYFGSPMALIFVGAFLIATLFSFFWAETFFSRNIADVRPLFRWMPILMVFLVATLTMRQWSEEQRAGTLEVLLTLPVRRSLLVLGKFIAVVALICLSLALTLGLPLTVSQLGNLDWGPVVGGYLATILMASAYAAIGLFISSRTDNQIVALILTVLLCGAFYVVGAGDVTSLVGDTPGGILRAIGTGSRFESIERGVIDLRDLAYYLSITALFLVLNIVSLDAKRWSQGVRTAFHRRNALLSLALVSANLLALNTWLFPVHGLRADLTAQKEYSLSPVTRDLVSGLQEPLLIRAYLSERTHPLLAPLAPTIRDLLREYEIVSGGKVETEVIDPKDNEDLETEATQVYGINPIPFRISGRYEASVINSYFDILIRYGDQHVTLNFQDLIEVNSSGDEVNVRLRNLEYDLTRSIKKVVYGFQDLNTLFAGVDKPVKLTAFVTPKTLPEGLQQAPQTIEKVAQAIQKESGGKFVYEIIDPDAQGASINRQTLIQSYGLQPMAVSFFSPDSYYLHMVLQIGDETQLLYPASDMSEASLRTEIESALKRAAPGFLKTIGLWLPELAPVTDMYGNASQPLSSWQMLRENLAQNYTVQTLDLTSGRVPGNIDVLVAIAPQAMDDKERFAIDQYLMRGGAVVLAAGSYQLSQQQWGNGVTIEAIQDGLKDMLASYGVKIGDALVLDPRNEPFPIQVQRNLGGMSVVEIQQVSYPFFPDVRSDGMAAGSPIVANLSAVTLQWASPVELDADKNKDRQSVVLLKSTTQSWLRSSLETQPDFTTYPQYGFPVEGEQKAYPLAVSLKGSFESYFKGQASPFQASEAPTATESTTAELNVGTIEASPDSSRLVVIGSVEFVDDIVMDISRSLSQDRYLFNLQFLQNAVDWAVEDEDLLSIRSRGTYARLLKPMEEDEQRMWEFGNYAVALLAIIAIGVVWNVRQRNEAPMDLTDRDIR